MTFPATEKLPVQVTQQVTQQVEELLKIFAGEHTRKDLQNRLELSDRENFRKNYLQSALDEELIELTIPEKPNSSKQKYRLTEKGILMKEKLL
jgi:ATP-dependent DNA helicase RecG